MNYKPGQQIILLDTTYKPVASATVIGYNPNTQKYTVRYTHPGNSKEEIVDVPELQLTTHPGVAKNLI